MIRLSLLPIFLLILSCVPQEGSVPLSSQSEGATSPNPTVSSVQVVGSQMTVNGYNFAGVTGLTIKDPATNGTKTFKVISANLTQLISQSIDAIPLPVGKALEMIFSNAYGQDYVPVTFTLSPNSVSSINIVDGAVGPKKLQGAPDAPNSAPPGGEQYVVTWDPVRGEFGFGFDSGSGSAAGVTSITKGTGIIGAPNSYNGAVSIAVDIGVKFDESNASRTIIPYFNSNNKIVIDSTTAPSAAISGISFKDGTKNFDLFNDNSLRIDSNSNADVFVLDEVGNLAVLGNIRAGGNTVCTSANNCNFASASSVLKVTATAPIISNPTTGNVNISLDPSGVVTSISAQPGITVGANVSGVVPVGVDFGPSVGTETTVQQWFKNLDDIGRLIPNNNAVIIGNATSSQFEVSSGPSLLNRIGAQPVNSNLTSISNIGTPTTGSMIVGGVTNSWTRQQIPNCGFNNVVQANYDVMGASFFCSQNGTAITIGSLSTNLSTGIILNATAAGSATEIHFMEGSTTPAEYVGFKAPPSLGVNTIWTLPSADGTIPGQALTTNAAGILSWSTNAIGNVVGPSTSTDFAIPRFNGATGRAIQNSGVLIDNANSITGVANFTAKGLNTNTPSGSSSAIDFMTGRDSTNALAAGQTSADLAFEYGGGGYKHYLVTTHGTTNSTVNSFRFYLNNQNLVNGSTSPPGLGNTLAMTVTPVGVGILNSSPAQALDVTGNINATGSLTINNNATNSSTFPTTRGVAGQFLITDGAGALSWGSPTVNAQTGTAYTLVASDCGNTVTLNNAAAITLSVPVLSIGCEVDIIQLGAGQVTVANSGLMVVENAFNLKKTRAQYSLVTVKIITATLAILGGDIN
jgi:hypothetical protein